MADRRATISVVIPVKDDAELLDTCLASLARQTRPPDEVIVVDNGSTDRSAAVARRHGALLLREARPGITAAASAGYDAARSDLIARCDADSRLPADWLERFERVFEERPDAVAVTGPGRFYDLGRVGAIVADVLYMRLFFLFAGAAVAQVPLFGSNFAIRASAWRRVSANVPRDEPELHDDFDLSFRLDPRRAVVWLPDQVVGISGRPFRDAGAFLRRIRRGGTTIRAHLRTNSPPQRWMRRWTRTRQRAGASR